MSRPTKPTSSAADVTPGQERAPCTFLSSASRHECLIGVSVLATLIATAVTIGHERIAGASCVNWNPGISTPPTVANTIVHNDGFNIVPFQDSCGTSAYEMYILGTDTNSNGDFKLHY